MSSRRYIKRIWRVPKDRGPVEYLATLICKYLRKHGWPAEWKPVPSDPSSFIIQRYGLNEWDLPPDFQSAVGVCARIVARTYRVDLSENYGFITLNRPYRVTEAGQIREIKHD